MIKWTRTSRLPIKICLSLSSSAADSAGLRAGGEAPNEHTIAFQHLLHPIPALRGKGKSSSTPALICTASRRISAGAIANHRPGKGDLIPPVCRGRCGCAGGRRSTCARTSTHSPSRCRPPSGPPGARESTPTLFTFRVFQHVRAPEKKAPFQNLSKIGVLFKKILEPLTNILKFFYNLIHVAKTAIKAAAL